MNSRSVIESISRHLQIVSPDRIRDKKGQVHIVTAESYFPGVDSKLQSPCPLIRALQHRIYVDYYSRVQDSPGSNDKSLLDQFVEFHGTATLLSIGWNIVAIGNAGEIFVEKDEFSRWALPGQYQAQTLAVGHEAVLIVQSGSGQIQQGYFHAFGASLEWQFEKEQLIRFYFNVDSSHAVDSFSTLAARLDKCCIPFQLKSPTHISGYARVDAMVLFVPRRFFQIVRYIVKGSGIKTLDGTPAFCKKLSKGIALAEDPGNGESFGMHRCRLVAEALKIAWARSEGRTDEVRIAIESHFERSGLTISAPFLNAGSIDLYEEI